MSRLYLCDCYIRHIMQMPRLNRPFSSNFTIKTTTVIFSLRPTTLSKHLLWSWNIAWQEDEKRFTTHLSDIYFFWVPCITQVKSRINCTKLAVCISTMSSLGYGIFSLLHSELPENSSKQVSVPQQSKDICLTSNFESNNFM